jgi:serine/threonine-protein kinase
VAYAIEIARALGAAHARHIVHRDVKPQNVLIDEEGSCKVTDFGIARTLDEEGLTADGRVLGTTDYVSPEQALGQPVTGQSDLYSLGVVLYEVLTGQVPFRGESQVAVAMKHVRESLPDVQAKRPEISAALAAVIDRATAKRLQDRYANDAELIADLEDVLAIETARTGDTRGEVTSVLQTLPARKRSRVPFQIRHRVRAAVLGALALAVIAGIAVWLANRAHHGIPSVQEKSPSAALIPVSLCQNCAHDYNPFGLDGSKTQNPGEVGLAIDGNRQTAWQTETYYSGSLGKPGVGIYVDAAPHVAAREIVLLTSTPGWSVQIWARNTTPNPSDNFPVGRGGWTMVGGAPWVHGRQAIRINGTEKQYRYYLVWITSLPAKRESASVNEITLYREKH